jgi:hypothetical protein
MPVHHVMRGRRPGHPGRASSHCIAGSSPAMTKTRERQTMDEADVNARGTLLRKVLNYAVENDLEGAARRFQLWRLCHRSACRHARACCGDTLRCCKKLVDWSEALVAADRGVDMSRVRRALMRQSLGESAT